MEFPELRDILSAVDTMFPLLDYDRKVYLFHGVIIEFSFT